MEERKKRMEGGVEGGEGASSAETSNRGCRKKNRFGKADGERRKLTPRGCVNLCPTSWTIHDSTVTHRRLANVPLASLDNADAPSHPSYASPRGRLLTGGRIGGWVGHMSVAGSF